jgi:solute carrier family 25 phosphate transporter 3
MIPDWINAFAAQHPLGSVSANASTAKNRPFSAWSALDDVKTKADHIAHEASREFDAASQKAQEKTGKIEPGSLKYYAACTFGGMMACVSSPFCLGYDRCMD